MAGISSPAPQKKHTLALLVDNEPGVLSRVVGLFSGRGYSIDSLTTAVVDKENDIYRITIVTSGTAMVIEQIKVQLARLVPVHTVVDLTLSYPHVERELALIKLVCPPEKRTEALQIAAAFRADTVDITHETCVFQVVGDSEKLEVFVSLMRELGLAEVARTGIVAIGRGSNILAAKQE